MAKTRNPNLQGTRKLMPDGRISYKAMVGKTPEGKPKYLQVYQRKGEKAGDLKIRFETELQSYLTASTALGENSVLKEVVKNGSNVLLKDFLKLYIEDFKKDTVKPTTLSFYINIVSSNIVPYIGECRLRDLKPIILQNYIKELCNKGLSYRTVKGALQLLKSALVVAVHNEILDKNPAQNIKIPKKSEKRDIKVFSKTEQKVFMKAIRGHLYETFFTLAITTGMRCGEMLGLLWEDVDFDKRIISVRQNLTFSYDKEEKTQVHIGTPKSSAGVRRIPIPYILNDALKKHQLEHYLMFGQASGFVFKTSSGGSYRSKGHFSKALKKICEENELPVLNLHALRHTFATRGLEAGVMPRTMQRLLGHEDFILFTTTYSHVLDDIYECESEKLVAAINDINGPVV